MHLLSQSGLYILSNEYNFSRRSVHTHFLQIYVTVVFARKANTPRILIMAPVEQMKMRVKDSTACLPKIQEEGTMGKWKR